MSILTEDLTLDTLERYVELSQLLLSRVEEMPLESRESWRHELTKNLERISAMRDEFKAAHRETTAKDRAVIMMAMDLSQHFLRIKKGL